VWDLEMDMGWNPIGSYMGLRMESMVGDEFEKGLGFFVGVWFVLCRNRVWVG